MKRGHQITEELIMQNASLFFTREVGSSGNTSGLNMKSA
jgi:hypothetical protein